MPVDYWNQFINTDDENVRSPPYNPGTHYKDGTPITPECRPGKTRQIVFFQTVVLYVGLLEGC